MNVWKRFTDLDNAGNKVNVLIYPFFFATLAYGIGFALFWWTGWVQKSSLWVAMSGLHAALPAAWGVCALIAVALAAVVIIFRKTPVGDFAALFGCMVWIFAIGCYIATGGYLLIFTVGIPNLTFWIWYFFRLAWFKRFGSPPPP